MNNKCNYVVFFNNLYIRPFMLGLFQGKENPPQHLAFPNLVANKSLCAKYFRRDVK